MRGWRLRPWESPPLEAEGEFPFPQALSVGQLTAYLADLLEEDPLLQDVWVRGEVSNFKRHVSGHCYFTLKDAEAQLDCVLFSHRATRLDFEPQDGMQVLAHGQVRVYPPRGRYQLYVDSMAHEGLGLLYAEFQRLFRKLQAEGLFDEARKRPLPAFPRWVGVITSPSGAAIRDILTVLRRRWPAVNVVFCPAQVQGEEAPASLIQALRWMNEQPEVEVIILGRGGGSIEDLWAFNDEALARAIFASRIPVVSAVGHERDFTLADYVADRRAPTPSAAAAIVVPEREEVEHRLRTYAQRFLAAARQRLQQARWALEHLEQRRAWRIPQERIATEQQRLDEWMERVQAALARLLREKRQALQGIERRLEALSPYRVLERGYSLVLRRDGRLVDRVGKVKPGERVDIRLADGRLEALIEGIEPQSR